MSSPSAQPDPHGSFSRENAPRVFVRAEKTFLCSSCGTLVEVPDDVVGQMVLAQAAPPEHSAEEVAAGEASPSSAPRAVATQRSASRPAHRANVQTQEQPSATKSRPARPKRPQPPQPIKWAGRNVDGLSVPSGHQLDSALKWVSFHLKVIDRQDSEIKRLKKLLKTESDIRTPRPSPLGRAGEVTQQAPDELDIHARQEHAQADLGVAPASENQHERGPP